MQLGRSTDQLKAALDRLRAERYVQRLWEKDASLWSSDPAVQGSIRRRLGWLTIGPVMTQQVPSLSAFAQEIRQAGLTHALLLGMGGSGLFPEVCRHLFGVSPGHVDLTVLDTTDPTAVLTSQRRCPLTQLLVIVSSKSGTTSEISALSRYFYDAFKAAGDDPGAHCVAITDAGTPLEAQAKAWKFRRIFTLDARTGADVGGRFSALTYFGLVPAALIGAGPDQLLRRGEVMLTRCGPDTPLEENPAVQLGVALELLAQQGHDKLTMVCARGLESFWAWVEQLVAESTGKQGRSIIPLHGEPLRAPKRYPADRVFVELQVATQIDPVLESQVDALAAAGHPAIRIRWQDRHDVGGEVVKWSVATAITGGLLGVNPFDEPDVNETKEQTTTLLSQYARDGQFPAEQPLVADGDVTLYGGSPGPRLTAAARPGSGDRRARGAGQSTASRSISQHLREFLQQQRPGDYVALLSFLPRIATLESALTAIRKTLASRLGIATLFESGPRYLHAIGQLFKGGANQGLFLQFTADDPVDVPVPGEAFTLGALKQAQGLGDFYALQRKGRRILRIHLRGDLPQALQRVASALDDATASLTRS